MYRSAFFQQSNGSAQAPTCHLPSIATHSWNVRSLRCHASSDVFRWQIRTSRSGENCFNSGGLGTPCLGRFRLSRRGNFKTCATAERKTIPIFPLNTVAFPAAAFPLHIFEARYRVLFNTLLKGADGLEDGLIQDDSPFAGTRRFGMCWSDSKGAIAAIGTTLQIESHVRMDDGRLGIENKGIERFKVLRICEERPVLICEVEVLEEDDDSLSEVVEVADEVRELFRTLIRLHVRKGTIKVGDEEYEPEELTQLGPRELSFWIASNFREMPQHQQILLQENSTLQRLKDEKAVLEGSVNYLRARLAVESAFTSDASSTDAGSEGSSGSEGASEGPDVTDS